VDNLLQIEDLWVSFKRDRRWLHAVRGLNLEIKPRETVCLVGESGSGKSVTALAIMGLIRIQGGRISSGRIKYRQKDRVLDLAALHPFSREMRRIRGNDIAMIFQEPMTSFNPVFTVGNQMMEVITLHRDMSRSQGRELAVELLRAVGIPQPDKCFDQYPHQLSGGMRQRVMIAISLSCDPRLLIADEPTTALDVTTQAQVLDLMKELRRSFQADILFITHDLGVVAGMADRVVVMYVGQVVESGPVREIFHHPLHPYTIGLLKSIPTLKGKRGGSLQPIRGVVPDISVIGRGCAFAPRCDRTVDRCFQQTPELVEVTSGHQVACHK
jgi:oligopeptide/dipeptide ABC transporter ATP-binding protein